MDEIGNKTRPDGPQGKLMSSKPPRQCPCQLRCHATATTGWPLGIVFSLGSSSWFPCPLTVSQNRHILRDLKFVGPSWSFSLPPLVPDKPCKLFRFSSKMSHRAEERPQQFPFPPPCLNVSPFFPVLARLLSLTRTTCSQLLRLTHTQHDRQVSDKLL